MILELKKFLHTENIIREAEWDSFEILFAKNRTFFVFTREGRFVFVRIAPRGTLDAEHHNLLKANQVLAARSPQVIAIGRLREFDLLVCEGIEHSSLVAGGFIGAPNASDQLAEICCDLAHIPITGDSLFPQQQIVAYARELALPTQKLVSVLAILNELAENATPAFQHCDFVINNIGITETGTLAVFDWEDAGTLNLNGLDVATMLASYHAFDAQRIQNFSRRPSDEFMDSFLQKVCAVIGIERDEFFRFLPAYLLCFVWLKKRLNYAPATIALLRQAIIDLT